MTQSLATLRTFDNLMACIFEQTSAVAQREEEAARLAIEADQHAQRELQDKVQRQREATIQSRLEAEAERQKHCARVRKALTHTHRPSMGTTLRAELDAAQAQRLQESLRKAEAARLEAEAHAAALISKLRSSMADPIPPVPETHAPQAELGTRQVRAAALRRASGSWERGLPRGLTVVALLMVATFGLMALLTVATTATVPPAPAASLHHKVVYTPTQPSSSPILGQFVAVPTANTPSPTTTVANVPNTRRHQPRHRLAAHRKTTPTKPANPATHRTERTFNLEMGSDPFDASRF
ncbi:MAG: hypothetical protein AAFX99_09285 [Myxococcota bacterium]